MCWRLSHLFIYFILLLVFNASSTLQSVAAFVHLARVNQPMQPPTIQRPPRSHLSLFHGCYLSVILQTCAFVQDCIKDWVVWILMCALNWLCFWFNCSSEAFTVQNCCLSYMTTADMIQCVFKPNSG